MHIMKLQKEYYNYIKNGTKKYEIRLNDEKRQKINIGDFIEFQQEPLKEEKIIYEVEDLIHFKNFNELIQNIDIDLLADKTTSKEELLNSLNKFYTKEEQNIYGVVAIKLKKDNNFVIEKNKLENINYQNKIFDKIKDNYSNFNDWYKKLINQKEECYFTKNNNEISSILIIKLNENDSQQIDIKNALKIRTLNVLDNNKGIASFYLKLIDSEAVSNNINKIYVTCKKDNKDFIKFITKNNYYLYKEYKDEYIYIKEIS